jgi:3-dehydroquinate dehydratase-2
MRRFIIINGPNLNLLGRRQPEIYGNVSFDDYFQELKAEFADLHLEYFQSNHEGSIIDKLHEIGFTCDGVILNPGAYTHTSIALADAVTAIESPVVEVHISNIKAREPFRRNSYIEEHCIASFVGHGLDGYRRALRLLLQ